MKNILLSTARKAAGLLQKNHRDEFKVFLAKNAGQGMGVSQN
jgi:hypothetical protein